MDVNSPGKPPVCVDRSSTSTSAGAAENGQQQQQQEANRARTRSRSRNRSRLSSRVDFYEQVWRGRQRSPSVEKTREAAADADADADSAGMDVTGMEERLENERRRRAGRVAVTELVPVHRLRRVSTSRDGLADMPAGDSPLSPLSPTQKVSVVSWAQRSRSPAVAAAAPQSSPVEEVAPWRLNRLSKTNPLKVVSAITSPSSSSSSSSSSSLFAYTSAIASADSPEETIVTSRRIISVEAVPPPSSSLSKYQQRRSSQQQQQQLKSPLYNQPTTASNSRPSVGDESNAAPWRKKRSEQQIIPSASPSASPPAKFSPSVDNYYLRRSSDGAAPRSSPGVAVSVAVAAAAAGPRKSSQPEWYSEYRSSQTMAQTAARLELLRGNNITSHYDFHIAEIKGERGAFFQNDVVSVSLHLLAFSLLFQLNFASPLPLSAAIFHGRWKQKIKNKTWKNRKPLH